MSRSVILRAERAQVHAALARGACSVPPVRPTAASLHRDLRLSCDPATARRWVQGWRKQAVSVPVGVTRAGPPPREHPCACGDAQGLAAAIAEEVFHLLIERLAAGGPPSQHTAG